MKRITHDEKGYPINFNPSTFYKQKEIFAELPSYYYNTKPGKYFVSNWGRIYNTELETYIPKNLIPDTNRYIITIIKDISNKEVSVIMHRLVARMFILPSPIYFEKYVINHIDGTRWHNEPYNLEVITQSENVIHADRTGLIARPFGEDNGCSALKDEQYEMICKLTQEGYLPYQINKIMNLGIDITNIAQKIRSGKSETLISEKYDFSNIPRNDYRKFTEEQVRYICQCLQDKPYMKPIEILNSMGYDTINMEYKQIKKLRDTISTIKRRVSYIEIGKDYNF